jgi:hypothetical protein
MRRALAVGLVLLAGLCLGQSQDSPNLFLTERQDVTIVARKSKLGPDDLTVTVENSYPKEQLQSQIQTLAQMLGSEVLGLGISAYNPNPQNPKQGYLRAIFGVRGLINREKGVLNLQALARAFAGGKPPVDVLYIQFETEAPSTSVLQKWRDPDGSVVLQGRASPEFGIEYKIKLNTQDPSKIRIPEGADAHEEQKPAPKAETPPTSNVWVWPVVILAALALGALVYSLLLKPRPSARPK